MNNFMILHELKELGFLISIDTIKIDKSFIDDIEHPIHQGSLVKGIIDMGQSMNFYVLAEGIENKEQVQFLIKNHCKYEQGYYFRKPLPVEEIEEYILPTLMNSERI
ncbi:EAL domain-containing protein [Niallia sp. 03190]|uniref:EAL domain-containing protein n=1 Tax=Niallia sp. 03190 TaxID=3458061 RepID=UPI004043A078